MSIITFISDFGNRDYHLACVKGRILSHGELINIVDISHHIDLHSIIHGSYVLGSTFRHFPEGTVHVIGLDTLNAYKSRHLLVKLEGHYFIGPDNGIFSLISTQAPSLTLQVGIGNESTFPELDIYADVAAKLALGENPKDLGEFTERPFELKPRQLKATKSKIVGHVEHVDCYGNLVTNIDKSTFFQLLDERDFFIAFGREKVRSLVNFPNEVEMGEVFAYFNQRDCIEIGVNKGNASELLGLEYSSPVRIEFLD
ncbi:SAM hydrolase/SAM-dependent halogenase family protein [Aureibacter tunicatorum]|uniref:S-adenosyl-l-methionine hydroxide adenosyltransferase n=1 Tax=Aureibacter tunicatorum TaxID=866807 RepID=A0AAE3XNL3_9BACT|nr:SAM-dependent chlorinase/fluorinase [Aureibacter tunicatorum]MDR6239258.1 hypothetical protein [Aureibacter tunicatorum]BDD04817.1 hypothetical protein AUTU_23000 [Aureibacter tunicatorum]